MVRLLQISPIYSRPKFCNEAFIQYCTKLSTFQCKFFYKIRKSRFRNFLVQYNTQYRIEILFTYGRLAVHHTCWFEVVGGVQQLVRRVGLPVTGHRGVVLLVGLHRRADIRTRHFPKTKQSYY